VGFEIYNSGKISEKDFELHVFLWGNGGPNWIFEEKNITKNYRMNGQWFPIKKGRIQFFKGFLFLHVRLNLRCHVFRLPPHLSQIQSQLRRGRMFLSPKVMLRPLITVSDIIRSLILQINTP
jgi:hypothetical protein